MRVWRVGWLKTHRFRGMDEDEAPLVEESEEQGETVAVEDGEMDNPHIEEAKEEAKEDEENIEKQPQLEGTLRQHTFPSKDLNRGETENVRPIKVVSGSLAGEGSTMVSSEALSQKFEQSEIFDDLLLLSKEGIELSDARDAQNRSKWIGGEGSVLRVPPHSSKSASNVPGELDAADSVFDFIEKEPATGWHNLAVYHRQRSK